MIERRIGRLQKPFPTMITIVSLMTCAIPTSFQDIFSVLSEKKFALWVLTGNIDSTTWSCHVVRYDVFTILIMRYY